MSKVFSVVLAAISAVFVIGGVYAITQGLDAKSTVEDRIVAENIITTEDAAIPDVLVSDYDTAVAQADVIAKHALEATEGKTYAEMEQDDPLREVAAKAASLRTSLYSTAMAFKLAELVTYLGAAFVVLGGLGLWGAGSSLVKLRNK